MIKQSHPENTTLPHRYSHQRPVRLGLQFQARHEDSAAYTVSTSSLTMEVEAVTHALRWIALRGESRTTHAIILTYSMSFLQSVQSVPRLECVKGRHSHFNALWVYCYGSAGVKGNYRADRLAGKETVASGLHLGRSEVLRSLRHYLGPQIQGYHIMEEGGEERGSARRSSLKGRERAIINQTNTGAVSKVMLGNV